MIWIQNLAMMNVDDGTDDHYTLFGWDTVEDEEVGAVLVARVTLVSMSIDDPDKHIC